MSVRRDTPIVLDENVNRNVAKELHRSGWTDIRYACRLQLSERRDGPIPDPELTAYAQRHNAVLVTRDYRGPDGIENQIRAGKAKPCNLVVVRQRSPKETAHSIDAELPRVAPGTDPGRYWCLDLKGSFPAVRTFEGARRDLPPPEVEP